MTGDIDAVVDRFRQAAFGMTPWSEALAGVATAMSASMVHLVGLDRTGSLAFNLIHGATDDMMAEYFAIGGLDPDINRRTRVAMTGTAFRCVVDAEAGDAPGHADSAIARLFRRSDADHAAMVPIVVPGARGMFTTMRGIGVCGGIASTDERRLIAAIAPAIADSVAQAMTLATVVDAATLATAATLGTTALLLDHDRRVVAMSAGAEALLATGAYLTQRRGRVVAVDPAGEASLATAFDRATDAHRRLRATGRVVLHDAVGAMPIVIDVHPAPERPAGPLSRVRAMLSVRPVARPVSAALLADLYRLTPAEANIAVALMAGCDLKTIAWQRGCTIATVRSQLKTLFGKTGTGRQGELIALLQQVR